MAKNFRPMNMKKENFVAMSAILFFVLRREQAMNKQRIQADVKYQLSISLARRLADGGVISRAYFNKIDRLLLEKYNPYLGRLFSPNA